MLVRLAAALGFSGVALGAFGAHALRDRLAPERLDVWRTAVLYHLLHAVALLAVAGLGVGVRRPRLVAGLLGAGVLLFSGSLYLLCLLDRPWLGRITPAGGMALLAGWAALAMGLVKKSSGESDGAR